MPAVSTVTMANADKPVINLTAIRPQFSKQGEYIDPSKSIAQSKSRSESGNRSDHAGARRSATLSGSRLTNRDASEQRATVPPPLRIPFGHRARVARQS